MTSLARSANSALDFLAARINYERTRELPYSTLELKLERMRELLARLGDPHLGRPTVHVAGTKGKGSAAAMIAAVLTASSRRTGLYTSPHLLALEERFRIDGVPCTPAELVALLEHVRPAVEELDRQAETFGRFECGPTWFEVTTAMAHVYFAQKKVGAAVLEVGLGGRLDSTNVCSPLVTVITSISFDHTRQLGNTLAAIAGEKAGIIKPGVPVVSGVQTPEARDVIARVAAEQQAPLWELGRDFSYTFVPPEPISLKTAVSVPATSLCGHMTFHGATGGPGWQLAQVMLGLPGEHQAANAAVALAALARLQEAGAAVDETAIRRGLAAVRWPARVEIVSQKPLVVLDAAHNVASVAALLHTLQSSLVADRRVLVFAASQDKDIAGMLRLLMPAFDEIIFTSFLNNPRSVPPAELCVVAEGVARENSQSPLAHWQACETPAVAWQKARSLTTPASLLCVAGSFFIAAEILPLLKSGMP